LKKLSFVTFYNDSLLIPNIAIFTVAVLPNILSAYAPFICMEAINCTTVPIIRL